ncbi:WbqC family protein [Rhodobacter capsulatus]|uniref:WbqC family protein n=1 Tax=Rhodobacter capsulatus TaxID=1061 RepID=UPI0040255826
MTTVAVMQPYFFPYGGYYRLLAAADVFVILDCVQFPRRGRVHRSSLPGAGRWITLPLEPAPRDSLISAMRLAPDAAGRLWPQCRKLPGPMPADTPPPCAAPRGAGSAADPRGCAGALSRTLAADRGRGARFRWPDLPRQRP